MFFPRYAFRSSNIEMNLLVTPLDIALIVPYLSIGNHLFANQTEDLDAILDLMKSNVLDAITVAGYTLMRGKSIEFVYFRLLYCLLLHVMFFLYFLLLGVMAWLFFAPLLTFLLYMLFVSCLNKFFPKQD
jgi:hypothetical protein